MREFIIGAVFGGGIWLVIRGLFPPRRSLVDVLADYRRDGVTTAGQTEQGLLGRWARISLVILRAVRADVIDQVEADIAVTGGSLEAHAVDKLNAAVGGAGLAAIVTTMFGIATSVFTAIVLAICAAIASYFLPDGDLRRKAAERRAEFAQTLTSFVGLAAVSISGGGGVNTAMDDAASIGSGWVFETLRQSLGEAALQGDSPWAALDALGKTMRIEPLIELAGALGLAGASGARVTETLRARAESGRAQQAAEAKLEAEQASASLGVPIGVILFGMTLFIGYPAIASLLSS